MIEINDKFKSLLEEKTRYYIITGERATSKSFTVNLILTLKLLQKNQNILFTRWTLSSAKDSIIPEFNEKIDLLGINDYMDVQTHDISSKVNNSKILFRGIKTSQGIQTAKLKSLNNINIWVLDEAEELVDEKLFDDIDLSVRTKGVMNMVVLIMNPANRQHWVYKRFFEKKVPENFNGIKDNITYIYTTLEDNWENIDTDLLESLLKLKKNNPEKYRKRMSTSWLTEQEGTCFPLSRLKRFNLKEFHDDNVSAKLGVIDTADEGADFFSFPIAYKIENKYYIVDVLHTNEGLDITKPESLVKAKNHELDYIKIETNNQGKDYYRFMKSELSNTTIRPEWTVQHKETRILMQAEWIIENCYFRDDYEEGSDYDIFMQHLTSYLKMVKNQLDDAADVMAALAQFVKKIFRSY